MMMRWTKKIKTKRKTRRMPMMTKNEKRRKAQMMIVLHFSQWSTFGVDLSMSGGDRRRAGEQRELGGGGSNDAEVSEGSD